MNGHAEIFCYHTVLNACIYLFAEASGLFRVPAQLPGPCVEQMQVEYISTKFITSGKKPEKGTQEASSWVASICVSLL